MVPERKITNVDRRHVAIFDANQRSPAKRPSWRQIAIIAIGSLVGPTVLKYALYERPSAAPRLRAAIGKRVVLPQRFGRPVPESKLLHVDYRLNDKWGWFDLLVQTENSWNGLSPDEATEVVIRERP